MIFLPSRARLSSSSRPPAALPPSSSAYTSSALRPPAMSLPAPAPAPAPLRSPPHQQKLQQQDLVFSCSEESALYSRGVQRLLQRRQGSLLRAVELGPGDGTPVLASLSSRGGLSGKTEVLAYELCPHAAAAARRNIASARLPPNVSYQVVVADFFSAASAYPSSSSSASSASAGSNGKKTDDRDGGGSSIPLLLIANPPYLPSPSREVLLLPSLYGGRDGADVTRRLLAEPGYGAALMIVAGVAAPKAVLRAASAAGYRVRSFEAVRLPFGQYTSQPLVRAWIRTLEDKEGIAHTLSDDGYVCAAVEFEKRGGGGGGGGGLEARLEAALTGQAWVDGEVVELEEDCC
jgi:hypothetical protein